MELFTLHGQSQPVVLKDPGVPKDVVDLMDTFDGLTVGHGVLPCVDVLSITGNEVPVNR